MNLFPKPNYKEHIEGNILEISFKAEHEIFLFPPASDYKLLFKSQQSKLFILKADNKHKKMKILRIETDSPNVLNGEDIFNLIYDNQNHEFLSYFFIELDFHKKVNNLNESKSRSLQLQEKLSDINKSEQLSHRVKI